MVILAGQNKEPEKVGGIFDFNRADPIEIICVVREVAFWNDVDVVVQTNTHNGFVHIFCGIGYLWIQTTGTEKATQNFCDTQMVIGVRED